MNVLEAILLGIVQGLTEFLPISSSGHLILVPWLADITYLREHPEFNKTFDVALHLGTLVAVVGYFRADVVEMTRGAVELARTRKADTPSERLTLAIVIATIPAVIVGGLFEDFIDEHLGDPWQIAILLAFFAVLLYLADHRSPQDRDIGSIGPRDALKIGVAQAMALAPGVSRSGVTITAGRWLGLDRDSAARFSFFLLIPATAGAVVLKGAKVASDGIPPGQTVPLIAGVIASAVSGWLAIAWLLSYVRRHDYDVFVIYRLLASAAVLVIIATGVRSATF
jgi:undecaprenyl-diphosphatase